MSAFTKTYPLARPIAIHSEGFWSADFAEPAALLATLALKEMAPTASTPSAEPLCQVVPSRLLRGSSRLTRMLGEVAAQAAERASFDLRTTPLLYSSSYGEIETMVALLDSIFRENGQVSPMRFKNSVHNASSGLVSIGLGNQAFSTAIAGGVRSVEAGFLELIALLSSYDLRSNDSQQTSNAVLALADDEIPAALATAGDIRMPLAVGFGCSLLAQRLPVQPFPVQPFPEQPFPEQQSTLATISALRFSTEAFAWPDSLLGGGELGQHARNNPIGHALPLMHFLQSSEKQAASIPLVFGVPNAWCLELSKP